MDFTKFSIVGVAESKAVQERTTVTIFWSQQIWIVMHHCLSNYWKPKRDTSEMEKGAFYLSVNFTGSWSTVSCRLDQLCKCLNRSYCSSAGLPFLYWPQSLSQFATALPKTHKNIMNAVPLPVLQFGYSSSSNLNCVLSEWWYITNVQYSLNHSAPSISEERKKVIVRLGVWIRTRNTV